MNPRIIGLLIKGNAEKEKYEIQKNNVLYHLLGQYVAEAIQATIGNAHRKKGTKPHEYPKKPFEIKDSQNNYSEKELQKQRELFVMKLMAMQSNYEISHPKNQEHVL